MKYKQVTKSDLTKFVVEAGDDSQSEGCDEEGATVKKNLKVQDCKTDIRLKNQK